MDPLNDVSSLPTPQLGKKRISSSLLQHVLKRSQCQQERKQTPFLEKKKEKRIIDSVSHSWLYECRSETHHQVVSPQCDVVTELCVQPPANFLPRGIFCLSLIYTRSRPFSLHRLVDHCYTVPTNTHRLCLSYILSLTIWKDLRSLLDSHQQYVMTSLWSTSRLTLEVINNETVVELEMECLVSEKSAIT